MRILATLLVTIACALPAFAQADETAKRFHVLPLIADGSGWQSFVLATNVAQSASPCTVELHGLSVDRFGDVIGVTAAGSTATFELAGRGGNLVWGTRNESALASGYATLDCVAPVVAQVVLASIDESGATTGMATVFSSQAGAVFQFPVLTADATVGFAIANDTDLDAACSLVLEDPQRVTLGEAALSAPSRSNVARMLNAAIAIPETFNGGSATVSCDRRVAMIGVHFELQPDRAIRTFNTLPLTLLDTSSDTSDETAKRFHVLPHIADGSGWQSSLLVTNVARATSQCTVELHGLSVDRFEDAGGVTAAGSTATFELGGAGDYLVWGTENAQTLASGYATLDCMAPVVAQVVLASIGASGAPTGMATVFSAQAGEVFRFPVLTPAATLGFAIANDTNADAECRIVLEDPARMNLSEAALSVPPKSSLKQMLNTAVAIPETFLGGTSTVSCDQQVAMTGIHMELAPNGDIITFNTLPPAVIDPVPPTVTLTVSPDSIDVGETVTLTWSSTNAFRATITPDIGDVEPSGSREVSPRVTTTYRIMVNGADGQAETASTTVTVNVSEQAALTALFHATGGENWTDNTNWLTDRPVSEWHGVQTDNLGRVTRLVLNENNLIGSIPAELGSLTYLTTLRFETNDLTGPIPPELGSLVNLVDLWLSRNRLTGPIPPELGSRTSLRYVSLSENELSGAIPPELGSFTNLTNLSLGTNNLTGPIPQELGALVNLTELRLDDNRLTGTIPPELGSLTNLTILYLGTNNFTGTIPPGLGSLVNLMDLWLSRNRLTGPIPRELGALVNLTDLRLHDNRLTGPIPQELLSLTNLTSLTLYGNDGLCAPGSSDFVSWLSGSQSGGGIAFCHDVDKAVLEYLYEVAGGELWTNSDGWGGDGGLGEWYGVSVDSLGLVTALDLSKNALEGRLPASLASLSRLTELWVDGNALEGRLPTSLTRLPLHVFHYADTELCAPTEASFQAWLGGIASHEGTGMECGPFSNRDVLVELYETTGGPDWYRDTNWLTSEPISEWHGVDVDIRGRVTGLSLSSNNLKGVIPPELGFLTGLTTLELASNYLAGPIPPDLGSLSNLEDLYFPFNELSGTIPPELGSLTDLTRLDLYSNELTGNIPPELGSLVNLERVYLSYNNLKGSIPPELGRWTKMTVFWLFGNQLTGTIPTELGNLSQLTDLALYNNQLTGPIPQDLGRLNNLTGLWLRDNQLTGVIPPELGRLTKLTTLSVKGNDLTGGVPAELGGMESLRSLILAGNPRMSGALPSSLTDLGELEQLVAGDTGLCAPAVAGFQSWLEGVLKRRLQRCRDGGLPQVYLTQAVQSRQFPVPLVAGEEALLRVFVTASNAGGATIPPVRARFYVAGRERHVVDIPGGLASISAGVAEGSLSMSANAPVPAGVVQPGLEWVVEIDPDGTLGTGSGFTKRIPESGRWPVDVQAVPDLDLTMIPFIWQSNPDASIVELVDAMAADPEGHELFWGARTLLPIADLNVTAHESVMVSTNSTSRLWTETQMIRTMEGGTDHFMGTMAGPFSGATGIADLAGESSVAIPDTYIIAHELGHNFNLSHAPCGGTPRSDPGFPRADGSIGAWGYDFNNGGQLVSPDMPDLMSYCRPSWISDYHFSNALRYRVYEAAKEGPPETAAAARSLLLWGGVDGVGAPFLEPAFVVDVPVSLPPSTGDYRIIGRTDNGEELFSLTFEMPEVADGAGGSSFAFTLPIEPGWAEELDGLTLFGPGGAATMDEDTNRPVTILRNPRTGQVRGILRGGQGAAPPFDDTAPVLALAPSEQEFALPPDAAVEALTSRGLPDPEDWR